MSGSILANLGLGGGQAGVPGAVSPSVLQQLMGGGAPGAAAGVPQHPIGYGANGFPTGISGVFANQGGGGGQAAGGQQAAVGADPLQQALAVGDALNKAAYGNAMQGQALGPQATAGMSGMFPSFNDPRLIQDRLSQYLQQAGQGQGGVAPGQLSATGADVPSGLMQMLAQYYLNGMMGVPGGAAGGYGGGVGGIGGGNQGAAMGGMGGAMGGAGGGQVAGGDPGGMGGGWN